MNGLKKAKAIKALKIVAALMLSALMLGFNVLLFGECVYGDPLPATILFMVLNTVCTAAALILLYGIVKSPLKYKPSTFDYPYNRKGR